MNYQKVTLRKPSGGPPETGWYDVHADNKIVGWIVKEGDGERLWQPSHSFHWLWFRADTQRGNGVTYRFRRDALHDLLHALTH